MPELSVEIGDTMGLPLQASARRDALAAETTRLAAILSRVGRRLKHVIGRLDMYSLPDKESRESLKWYSETTLGLLKEQRERAKLAQLSGLPQLSEEEHQQALEAFRRETMLSLTDEELARLAAERQAARGGS